MHFLQKQSEKLEKGVLKCGSMNLIKKSMNGFSIAVFANKLTVVERCKNNYNYVIINYTDRIAHFPVQIIYKSGLWGNENNWIFWGLDRRQTKAKRGDGLIFIERKMMFL